MELMNCRNCKKLFNYIAGEKLCPACKEKLEEKFQKVKKYIEENPRENINQDVYKRQMYSSPTRHSMTCLDMI